MYSYNKENVYWNGKLIYKATGEVVETLNYEDMLILRYKVSRQDKFILNFEMQSCNVISIDKNGTLMWRIKDRPGTMPSWFDRLYIEDADVYRAGNVDGYEYKFNPKTGDILGSRFVG